MRRLRGTVVVIAIVSLAAGSVPVAGNGGHQPLTKQGTFGDWNVTFFSSKGLAGGETLNAGWQAQHVETGANYTENTTATFTFRDADNATINATTVNATRFRETEFLVSYVRIAEDTRWMDAELALPNATATFGQPIGRTAKDDPEPPKESTPLPAAVVVTALAAAWWLRRR